MGRILVADDHDSLRRGIVRALSDAHHEVEEAPNGNVAIEKLHEGQYDVVLSDLKMGGSDGLDVLRTAKSLHPTTAVILMTAFGSVHTAVEAMKIGAFDYVQKPFEIEEMELKIAKAIEHRRLRHEIEYLRHTQQDIYDFDRIVGASGALQSVLSIVKKVAKSNTTVLIRGETGTGKELIAGAIHHNSLRAARNFVKVNCAALQENLLESELFGHEKGAFTGELKKKMDGLSPDALKLLMRYNWPGNIRELENAIERAALLTEGPLLSASDLRLGELSTSAPAADGSPVVKIPPTGIALEEIERQALIEALKMSNWVQKDAAELLAISPRVMNYKIKTLGIEYPRGRRMAVE